MASSLMNHDLARGLSSCRGSRVLAKALAVLLLAAATASAQEEHGYGAGMTGTPSPSGGQFEGSVPAGRQTAGVLELSLPRAIELGLANNLGFLLTREGVSSARGQRWVELSKLLPNLSTQASMHHLQESLAITGISLPGVPAVTGPFNYYDARVFLSQRLFDLEAIKRSRAASHEVAAAELSLKDAREIVVAAVGSAYLQVLADYARVETVRVQLATAQTILERAVELHKAGVSPGIDELRARVEFLTRSQQLIVVQNDFAKQKLSLIRLIGLPVGQQITLDERLPFGLTTPGPVDQVVARALGAREDYRAAEQLLKSAEASSQAARAQRLPSLVLDADYGVTGVTLSSLYGTYHVVGSIKMPIFEGGRIHGDVLQAEARVRQRRDELGELGSRIEFEVRTALLDVDAAARQLAVSRETVELAELTLYQAQERFIAGINDNLEVVQAQQAVATAHEALVTSQYQYNLARLLLAKAMGVAEEGAAGVTGGS
jgi:outer membrane protein TolC